MFHIHVVGIYNTISRMFTCVSLDKGEVPVGGRGSEAEEGFITHSCTFSHFCQHKRTQQTLFFDKQSLSAYNISIENFKNTESIINLHISI
jgi:hypothetical protein